MTEKWAEAVHQIQRFGCRLPQAAWLAENRGLVQYIQSVCRPVGAPAKARRSNRQRSHRQRESGRGIGGLKATVDTVRALGKRVVVVAPPPRVDMDFVRCAERIERKLPVMGVVDQCKIGFNAYRKEQADVLEFLAALPQFAHVDVIDFDSHLGDAAFCRTFVNDTFIYRDAEHLSYDGSVALANAVSLTTKIRERAK